MSDQYAIETTDLTKRFGNKTAVDQLTLKIPRGSVFGLLGRNGAGKTTAIRMAVGQLHPTSGDVLTLGVDPYLHGEAENTRIAYVSESTAPPAWMSVRAVMQFYEQMYPRWNARLAETLCEEWRLDRREPYAKMSKGRKRLTLLLPALCQGAELLILDEPAAGLDVPARRNMLEQILNIACEGDRTVLLSSHILSDLERVVDRVAILDEGRLVAQGELDQLKTSVRRIVFEGLVDREELASSFQVLRISDNGRETQAAVADFSRDRLNEFLTSRGDLRETKDYQLNLEDLFLEMTGN
jgi:ABC-2 type transport system ATP-binding protein